MGRLGALFGMTMLLKTVVVNKKEGMLNTGMLRRWRGEPISRHRAMPWRRYWLKGYFLGFVSGVLLMAGGGLWWWRLFL